MNYFKMCVTVAMSLPSIYGCDYASRIITIINESDTSIIFYIPNAEEGLTSDFNPYNMPKTLQAGNKTDIISTSFSEKQMFKACYPLSVYFFEPDIVDEYGWEKVMDEEMFVVHYVPSADDARRLDRRFSYPPNEDMRNVLMYPPYEEVIENYNRMMEQEE